MVASRGLKMTEAHCSKNSRKIIVQTVVASGIGNGACAGCRWSRAAKDCDYYNGKSETKSSTGTSTIPSANQTPRHRRNKAVPGTGMSSSPVRSGRKNADNAARELTPSCLLSDYITLISHNPTRPFPLNNNSSS